MIAWICIPVGLAIIVYARIIHDVTGDIPFAEDHFGGGTTSFYKLLGLVLMIFSFMWAMGGIQAPLQAAVEPFV